METPVSITKKLTELKLAKALLGLLSDMDFIHLKKDNSVIRKSKTGFERFGFDILNYWPYCVEISLVGISIRFDMVESIIAPIEVRAGLRTSLRTAKTDMTMWKGLKFKTQVFTEQDLDDFIFKHINQIKEEGLIFFDKYKDISTVNLYHKNIVAENRDYLSNEWNAIATSLTLMKLCDDKDFDELKIAYRQKLRFQDTFEKETYAAYDDLVDHLSKM